MMFLMIKKLFDFPVLMDLLKFGLTGSSSVAEARIHSQLQPDVVYAEGWFLVCHPSLHLMKKIHEQSVI